MDRASVDLKRYPACPFWDASTQVLENLVTLQVLLQVPLRRPPQQQLRRRPPQRLQRLQQSGIHFNIELLENFKLVFLTRTLLSPD